MHQDAIFALSVIGIVAIFCQWFAWWVKLPAIVFLLIAGVILGPLTGWLNPGQLFGDLLFPMVSLAVAIILFEGSLTLKFDEIRGLQKVVRNMLTIGVAIAWTGITLATHYVLGFDWSLSLLFGAMMVVTGPTVIVPILRTVRPNATISNILRWEGIVLDPLGAILAVLVFEAIVSIQLYGHTSIGDTTYMFIKTLILGSAIGGLAAYLFGLILRKHLMPEYLHNVATLCLVFGVFSLSNHLTQESGLLAITVMGIWLANMKNVPMEDILNFKESLSLVLISGLFILLAARLEFAQFTALGIGALFIFLLIQFVIRPLQVLVSTKGSNLTWQEKTLISWIGPRGIVAAAVTALFALRLEDVGVEQAGLLVPLAFTIIIGTVILQGATAKFIAQKLGVADPDDSGFLIIGANPTAIVIAKALNDSGYRTRVTDTSWTNAKAARMAGLDSYYGNAVSDHADRHLDLIGLGQVLALTPQKELNALAGLRFRSEFGRNNVYTVNTEIEKESKIGEEQESRTKVTKGYHILFGDDITFSKLASLIAQGAKTKKTKLSESFDYEAYKEQYGSRAIPLFAVNSKNRLYLFTETDPVVPEQGWTIVSLVQEEKENELNDYP